MNAPQVARDFGHDPVTLDRVVGEHCLAIVAAGLRHRAQADGRQSGLARALGYAADDGDGPPHREEDRT